MKKIAYILSLISLSVGLISCDQDIDYPYNGGDRVQFKFFDVSTSGNSIVRTEFKSKTISLGLLNDTIRIDTAKIVIELLGNISKVERKYKVSVVADSTTAESGVHYEAINEIQTFRKDKVTDTLRVVIFRDALSSNFNEPEDKTLYLKLEPTEDFDLGLSNGREMKFILNNYLTEPKWWKPNFFGSLDYFHPKKWKILIGFDVELATYESISITQNDSKGREYQAGLSRYLVDVPTYDDYTGDRILMNSLQPQE